MWNARSGWHGRLRLLLLGVVLAFASCGWSEAPVDGGDTPGAEFRNESGVALVLQIPARNEERLERLPPGTSSIVFSGRLLYDPCVEGLVVAVPDGPEIRRLPKTCDWDTVTITEDEVAKVLDGSGTSS